MATTKTKTAETFPSYGKDMVETWFANSQKMFEQSFGKAPFDLDSAKQGWFKGYDDAVAFGQANLDAALKAGEVMSKGFEDMAGAIAKQTQAEVETGFAVAKELLGCKTLQDIVEVQTAYMKGRYDAMMANTGKLADMAKKVSNDVAKPINERVNATVDVAATKAQQAAAKADAAKAEAAA